MGKRPDKKEKLLNKKNTTEIVVKCALAGSIPCNDLMIWIVNQQSSMQSIREYIATLEGFT
jgi:hypothetical protein